MMHRIASRLAHLGFALAALLLSAFAVAQLEAPDRVVLSAAVQPRDVRAGESAQIVIRGTIEENYHIYALGNEGDMVSLAIDFDESEFVTPNGDPVQPPPIVKYDRGFQQDTMNFEGAFAIGVPIRISENAAGTVVAKLFVTYQACDARSCDMPKTVEIDVPIDVQPGAARTDRLETLTSLPEQPDEYVSPEEYAAKHGEGETAGAVVDATTQRVQQARNQGLLQYMWLAFVAGVLALMTPCVWPMIPITVSFFSKRTEDGTRSNVKGALAYCLGIMGTFTALGVVMTLIFGASGIQSLATNPFVNLGLAILFVVLALNLFGVFEIVIPQALVGKAQAGSRRGGLVGPILMGLTFSLTSFTCTVPFVGTILVAATQGDLIFPIMGMLAFSLAFAIPFFFLAMFPQYLAKMPKSGSWLNTVKAYMGFLELAAAAKFLSNAELTWPPVGNLGLMTRPVFLSIWSTIFLIAGLYLMGWLKFGKDPAGQKIGWFRFGFGVANVGVALWFLAAMQGSTSIGRLSAFLPPDPYPGRASTRADAIVWKHTLEEGLEVARAENRPVFINFTGVTCTNCRYMENDVFPASDVRPELERFVLVELYTDRGTPEDKANAALRERLTNTATNPVYVVMTPDERIVNIFAGSSLHNGEFIAFLNESRQKAESQGLTVMAKGSGPG